MEQPRLLASINPYMGPFSFQFEDRELYFGRYEQTERLVGLVGSSRVSILHAQSGAGKTSLLNARVIPRIDSLNIVPIRCTPEDNPMEAIAAAMVRDAFLHPDIEIAAIDRALRALPRSGNDPTISALLESYRALPLSDESRRVLLQPHQVHLEENGPARLAGSVRPHFVRLLAGVLSPDQWMQRVSVLQGTAKRRQPTTFNISIQELRAAIDARKVRERHRQVLTELSAPIQTLETLFKRTYQLVAASGASLNLCVIIDQFEEIFARFSESKSRISPRRRPPADWRLKHRFFEEFTALLQARVARKPTDESAGTMILPVKFIISLREEYFARLQPLSDALGDITDCSMRLGLLTRGEALEGITNPAERCGFEVPCATEILSDLVTEDRYVEPTHLQIVCDHLWRRAIAPLLESSAIVSSAPKIAIPVYDKEERAAGILRCFIEKFFTNISELERFEALSLLGELITSTGTRNIVERQALIHAPFRDSRVRGRMLAELVKKAIVRVEPRVGGEFAEVTHEFLIDSILDSIHAAEPDQKFKDLERASMAAARPASESGDSWEEFTSGDLSAIERVKEWLYWEAPLAERVFRSAVARGAGEELIKDIAARLGSGEMPSISLGEAVEKESLTRDEWRASETGWRSTKLTSQEAEFLLRAAIELATEEDKDRLVYWTREAGAVL